MSDSTEKEEAADAEAAASKVSSSSTQVDATPEHETAVSIERRQVEDVMQQAATSASVIGLAALKIAREKLGLSIEEVAQKLHISCTYVEGIETSNTARLPEATFARGYIRNYAKLVKVDGKAMVEAFDQIAGIPREAPPLRGISRVKPLQRSRVSVNVIGAVLLILFMAGSYGVWYYLIDVPAADDDTSSLIIEPAPMPVVDEAAIEASLDPLSIGVPLSEMTEADIALEATALEYAVEEAVAINNSAVEGVEASTPTAVTTMAQEGGVVNYNAELTKLADAVLETSTPVAKPVRTVELKVAKPVKKIVPAHRNASLLNNVLSITFVDKCWIEVKDANGKIVISAVKNGGDSLMINVLPPARVSLGNVDGVDSISFNNTAVSLPETDGRVVRFNIGQR